MIWVVFARRVGLGYRWGFGFVALSIGVSMAFPFYLIVWESFLDRRGGVESSTGS